MTIYKIIDSLFANIYDEIGKVYLDMAESHLSSAKQAYKAYQNSRNPETEIRVLLNHLRDTYNIYNKAVRRKVTETTLIFWSSTSKLQCSNENTLLVVNIATIISFLYKELNELKNARDWGVLAVTSFDYHSENYKPQYRELVNINPYYGYTKRERTSRYEYTTYCYVSDQGIRYAKDRLETQKRELKEMFNLNLEGND